MKAAVHDYNKKQSKAEIHKSKAKHNTYIFTHIELCCVIGHCVNVKHSDSKI